jgi:Uma2 family endonuclease
MTTIDRVPMVTPADDVPGPKQGEWTYNHYAALPDDGKRYEVVNGVLYMSPSPNWPHQEIAGAFYRHLYSYVESRGIGGAFTAPLDVQLGPKDVFQPDVVVLLKTSREKLKKRHIIGPPDLVVEVVSPGSETHDRYRKIAAYARGGVPEYWIADPGSRTVEVLLLEGSEYRSLGVYEGKAMLPSLIVPGLAVHVEQFFESIWNA